jgi:hypothetical protein
MAILDSVPPELQTEYSLVYEARAVYDTSGLQFSTYLTPVAAWVVAVITPAKGSGAAAVPGAYIEVETGKLHKTGQSELAVTKEGTWRAIAAADDSILAMANYSWSEPLTRRRRTLTPEDFYSPFAYGGTVLFRPEPAAEGVQRFGDCRLLFPEWGRAAADALKAAPQWEGVLGGAAKDQASLAEVHKLAAGNNGILSSIAFRTLLQSPDPFAVWTPALYKAADTRKLSVFVYLGLVASGPTHRPQWVVEFTKLIRETKEPDRLLGIAYAAFAAYLFSGQDAAIVGAASQILGKLRARLEELGTPVPNNSPWFLIFKKAGVIASP